MTVITFDNRLRLKQPSENLIRSCSSTRFDYAPTFTTPDEAVAFINGRVIKFTPEGHFNLNPDHGVMRFHYAVGEDQYQWSVAATNLDPDLFRLQPAILRGVTVELVTKQHQMHIELWKTNTAGIVTSKQ